MVSQFPTDPKMAVMCQETQQCANKGREEEDHKLVYMDVNKAGGFANVLRERKCICSTFKEFILVGNTECKQKLVHCHLSACTLYLLLLVQYGKVHLFISTVNPEHYYHILHTVCD